MISDIEKLKAQCEARVIEEERTHNSGNPGPTSEEISSKFIRQCLSWNELGDGILFEALNRDLLLFNKSADRWMAWAGHHWKFDIMGVAKARVELVCEAYAYELFKVAAEIAEAEKAEQPVKPALRGLAAGLRRRIKQLRSTSRLAHCLEFAHHLEDPLAIAGDEIDQNPYLLACPNGVMDLRTGHFRPGRQDEFLLKATRAKFFGFDAPRAKWEAALEQIFCGKSDVIAFFKRLVGMALVGEVVEQVLIILWGSGCNGKTLVMEIIAFVLGDLAGSIQSEMLLSQGRVRNSAGPSPDLMSLRGLRIAVASETDEDSRVSASRIKLLSGGDRITGRSPHDKFMISFTPSHTLFLLTNSRPGAPGSDFAFWRRVHLIEFAAQFCEKPESPGEYLIDKGLGRALRDEAPGILAWMIDGCLEWQKFGLNPPAAVIEATSRYRSEEDLLGQFLDEYCELGVDFQERAADLYDQFKEWFRANCGSREPSQKVFGGWMVKRFERGKGKPRKYFGVRLAPKG